MKIRVKIQDYNKKKDKLINKSVMCDVASLECKNYECLHVGKWLHQNIMDETIYRDDYYSCLHRNYHGCPEEPKKRAKKI